MFGNQTVTGQKKLLSCRKRPIGCDDDETGVILFLIAFALHEYEFGLDKRVRVGRGG